MLLSEHVYCVAAVFKMTEQGEQQMCIKFCIKLKHSSVETGDWQLHHNTTPTPASRLIQSVLEKRQITQVTQPPYSPDRAPCDFWLLPKLKSPLKGKRFQTVDEIQENTTGQLMATRRAVWGPNVPTLKGTEVSLTCAQCFLYPVSSSLNVSVFHIM